MFNVGWYQENTDADNPEDYRKSSQQENNAGTTSGGEPATRSLTNKPPRQSRDQGRAAVAEQ